MLEFKNGPGFKNHGAFQFMGEFADVPGPAMCAEAVFASPAQGESTEVMALRHAGEEFCRQIRKVGCAFPQRRKG